MGEHISAGRFISIKIGDINTHNRYEYYEELLTLTDYSMTSSNSMTAWAMSACLNIHPINVVRSINQKNAQYICVAGLRSLLLAKSILGIDANVQVVLHERLRNDIIDIMISADILFTHLLFSVKKPETLGRIYNKIPPDHLSCLLVESARTKTGFADQTSYVYNTLFPQAKTKP